MRSSCGCRLPCFPVRRCLVPIFCLLGRRLSPVACYFARTSRVLCGCCCSSASFARTSPVLRPYFARTSPVLRMYFARAVHVLRAYSARTSHVLRVHFSSSSLVLRPYFAIHVPVHAWNLRARRLCFGCMSCAFSTSPILRFYFGRTSLVFCTCLARASPNVAAICTILTGISLAIGWCTVHATLCA